MATHITSEKDFQDSFNLISKEVIKSVGERAKKLLQQHINADTYGIGKNVTGHPKINKGYLDRNWKTFL